MSTGSTSKISSAFFRDRTKELRKMRAGDLAPNPLNWRRHSTAQIKAMQGILREVGYAGALLAREEADGAVVLIDGHLRQSLNPDQVVPVLILDVTEEEANKVLATYDPISTMADADAQAYTDLLTKFTMTDADAKTFVEEEAQRYQDALSEIMGQIDKASEQEFSTEPQDIPHKFLIIVECVSDAQQAELLERLNDEGYSCRASLS